MFVRNSTGRSRLATLAREAAGDHQNCAVKFTSRRATDPPRRCRAALRRAVCRALATFEPPPVVDGPLQLLERHACVYQGRRFGHVVFRYRGALASLLVTDAAAPSAPELEPAGPGPAVAVAAGGTIRRLRRRRSRSPACPAPGAGARDAALTTPRLARLLISIVVRTFRSAVVGQA